MDDTKRILKIGAICSLLSALTTAILMYGPNAAPVSGFDAAQAQAANPLYMYKKWILFFHPQFAFVAALSAAVALWREARVWVLLGLLYLGIWAYTEMAQQAFLIDAVNQMWRPAYLASSGDDAAIWRTLIEGSNGISDSQYFLLIFGFGAGSLFFGFAFLRGQHAERALGVAISLIGAMSLLAFFSYYAGASFLSPVINSWYGWIYGPLQILARLAIGYWLWTRLRSS